MNKKNDNAIWSESINRRTTLKCAQNIQIGEPPPTDKTSLTYSDIYDTVLYDLLTDVDS